MTAVPQHASGPEAEAEAALWRALRTGSRTARERLFVLHAGFARGVALRHFRDRRGGDLELPDLRQLAYVGLLEAIDRFDPGRGVPFRGYAARRIAGSVLDGVAHASELREQAACRNRIRAERLRSLAPERGGRAAPRDALDALADLAAGLAIGFMLDSGLVASEDTADHRPSAYESLAWRETIEQLHAALGELPEREQHVLRQHYLQGMAFDLIADVLGLSKGRVSQLHRSAIERLRRRLSTRPGFRLEQ